MESQEKIQYVEGPKIIASIEDITVDAYQRLLIENHNLFQHIEAMSRRAIEDAMGVKQASPMAEEPITSVEEVVNHYSEFDASLRQQISSLQGKNTALENVNRNLRRMNEKQSETIVELKDMLKASSANSTPTADQHNDMLVRELTRYTNTVSDWIVATFGKGSVLDLDERALRFLEEAMELAQACGLSVARVDAVRNYVYGRPVGSVRGEIGGVIHTLAALAAGAGMNLGEIAIEAAQSGWERQAQIKEKNAKKPTAIRSYIA